jgi:L-arabinonolactonase
MSLSDARLIEEIDVRDELGEGVLWRQSDSTVWWIDILGRRIHCLAWPSLKLTTYPTPERPGSIAFIEGRDDALIVAFESGFAVWSPQSGDLRWLSRPVGLGDGVRLNDGRVDPDGRFWAGSMAENGVAEGALAPGVLFRLGPDGQAAPVLGGIHISNGICWSSDGSRMYLADSPRGEVYVADYNRISGVPGRFEVFARFSGEGPDGAVTDAAGNYWTALWGGSRVAAFAPDGNEIAVIPTDVPQPSCPVFGGPNRNLLFVTTARQHMAPEPLAKYPRSGNLFVFETSATGAPIDRARLG